MDVGTELLCRGVGKLCEVRRMRGGGEGEEGGNEALREWHVWVKELQQR